MKHIKSLFTRITTYLLKSNILDLFLLILILTGYIALYLMGYYQNVHEYFDNLLSFVNILLLLATIIVALNQYLLSKKEKEDKDRPYIFLNLDTDKHPGLCDIEIMNIGGSPATDIQITFNPNIQTKLSSINEISVFKNLSFLPQDKGIRMFFGSIIGANTEICQRFEITINYKDTNGMSFPAVTQYLDPREYLGRPRITEKNLNDVAKEIEKISKNLDKLSSNSAKFLEHFKNGINLRNSGLENLKLNETLVIIRNIIAEGMEDDVFMNPHVYDFKLLLKHARLLVLKSYVSKKDKNLLQQLNNACHYHMYIGPNEEWKKILVGLSKEIDLRMNNSTK